MDLPPGLQEMIDEYVAEALDSTGTRKARSRPRAVTPPPIANQTDDDDTLIPIEIELEETDGENELFVQLSQQLASSQSALEALPRDRAARGSIAPLPAVVDDDEVTNVVGKPKG